VTHRFFCANAPRLAMALSGLASSSGAACGISFHATGDSARTGMQAFGTALLVKAHADRHRQRNPGNVSSIRRSASLVKSAAGLLLCQASD